MSELTTWLLEQIAADEAVARAAMEPYFLYDLDGKGPEEFAHIARHDPARVLAECAAKRRIVEEAAAGLDFRLGKSTWAHDPYEDHAPEFAESVLRALASVYAGADGWREEWA